MIDTVNSFRFLIDQKPIAAKVTQESVFYYSRYHIIYTGRVNETRRPWMIDPSKAPLQINDSAART